VPGALDIAVVGAGVTGLAGATLLARDGHRVVLFERFESSRPLGSGLMLQPTGQAALARLGLLQEIETLGARVDRLHGVTDTGATVFDLAYAELDPTYYAIGIHRAALHTALWQAFVACGARLETDCSIEGVELASGGKATLRHGSGRAGAAFDLILDASGARSPLRGAVVRNGARAFSYGAVWASVPDLGVAPACLAQRYVGARVMIGYLPIGRATASGPQLAALFWSLKTADYQAWREDFARWRERVVQLWPELKPNLAGLSNPDHLTLASYMQFTAARPFKGPLALIGDSAHATSPQLGQGANSGLLDALALRDALAVAPDIASALALYASRRRDHVRFYQVASWLLTPFFQSDSTTLALARDLTFHRLKLLPYLQREMLRTLAGVKTGLFSHRTPKLLAGG
jgi:2-polyprenyl-6-methoxyphenol hydroxylase-like FAD-dependent oxidoreductase